jgi:hypothetical protein
LVKRPIIVVHPVGAHDAETPVFRRRCSLTGGSGADLALLARLGEGLWRLVAVEIFHGPSRTDRILKVPASTCPSQHAVELVIPEHSAAGSTVPRGILDVGTHVVGPAAVGQVRLFGFRRMLLGRTCQLFPDGAPIARRSIAAISVPGTRQLLWSNVPRAG